MPQTPIAELFGGGARFAGDKLLIKTFSFIERQK